LKAIVAALVVSLWSFTARADGAIHFATAKSSGPQCLEGPNPTPKAFGGSDGGGSVTVTAGRKPRTWKICSPCGLVVDKEGPRVVRVTGGRCPGVEAQHPTTSRGGNLTFGGRPWRHSEIAPRWGIDVQDARGNSLVRLSPDGDVFAEGKLVENDPEHRALNAFASWMQVAMHGRKPEGAFEILRPGVGSPIEDRALDGETIFTNATGATILKLGPRSGWVAMVDGEERPVCGRALYGAFLLWLDGAEPGHGFRATAERMIKGTSSSDCITLQAGAGGVN
jgi:hypothetical protein